MTNPENNSAIKTAPKAERESAAENTVRSEFLERVSEIPVVNAAKEYSTAAYNQVKQLNRFNAAALSAAEIAALYFAVNAKPFLEKVQPQAQIVDQLACRGLDTVEEKVPFLMKPPEQLVEDARKLCTATVEMGFQTVEGIETMGSKTLSSVKNYGLQKANDALDFIEELVDRYLPPAFGEGSPEAERESNPVLERASKLTSKIGLCVYGHGVKQLLSAHKIFQESVSKLVYTVELESRWNSIQKAREKTIAKHKKFIEFQKEFSLNMLDENNASSNHLDNSGSKRGSYALKFEEALSDLGIALEEERKTCSVTKGRSYFPVIKCVLEKLDIPKEKIDYECELCRTYKSLYNDLNNNTANLTPLFEELSPVKKNIGIQFGGSSDCEEKEDKAHQLGELHSNLLTEDELLTFEENRFILATRIISESPGTLEFPLPAPYRLIRKMFTLLDDISCLSLIFYCSCMPLSLLIFLIYLN